MIDVDTALITDTLRTLVRINSVNPALDPGGPGEAEIAAWLAARLRALGLKVAVHEPAAGRPSVVGRLRGRGGGRSLMLNAHTDTVGVTGMADPFAATIRDGRLYGRGAYDMKGSLAACIGAAEALVRGGIRLQGDLLLAAVADEEHASLGTCDVARRYTVDGAIVTEPTGLDLCVAHKGFAWFEVVTRGRAAHGSRPELGIDANVRMGRVLARIERLASDLETREPHPLLGRGSIHAATLVGGTGLSTYAAECRLGIERRTLPGDTDAGVESEIRGLLDGLAAEDPSFQATMRVLLTRPPFETRAGSALAAVVTEAIRTVDGTAPRVRGDTPWMDSAVLAEAGADTVVFGPDGAGAHAVEEWVDLDSVMRAARVLADAAVAWCGTED
ncbi:MAG: ArgE/DapE family deacylase [Gemmatimonadota bacterium]|jgi:acetylornithine deacetylase